MIELSETDKAYIAGLFDGEGCICLTKLKTRSKHGGISPEYHLIANITNTYLSVLEWIQMIFRGNLNLKLDPKSTKPGYRLEFSTRQAVDFLSTIQPYLKIKLDQCHVALQYIKWFDSLPSYKGKRCGIPEEILIKKEEFKTKIQMLNKGAMA